MGIVITFVDDSDPVWKRDYETCTKVPVIQKRFREGRASELSPVWRFAQKSRFEK